MKKIPKSMQGVLWSSSVEDLDIEKHKSYIIHQTLMYGSFDQIKWLFNVYSKERIVDVFLNKPQKVYTKPALNYINKFILELGDQQLQEDKYVNAIY